MACERTNSIESATSSAKLKGSFLRESLPLSILDISSTSLIRLSKWLLESPIFFRQSNTRSRSSICVVAMAVIPKIAFIGVLISWLIFDRNWLFASLADLALSSAL